MCCGGACGSEKDIFFMRKSMKGVECRAAKKKDLMVKKSRAGGG